MQGVFSAFVWRYHIYMVEYPQGTGKGNLVLKLATLYDMIKQLNMEK